MQMDIEERLDIIRHKLKFIDGPQRPATLLLRSLFPRLSVDDPSILALAELAGGRPEDQEQPELIVIITEAPMHQLLGILPDQLAQPEWAGTPAVQNNRVYVVDGKRFLRPVDDAPARADDAELLAEIIHPKQFVYGYNGEGWIQFDLS